MKTTGWWCWATGVVCWGLAAGGCAGCAAANGAGAGRARVAEIVQRGVVVLDRQAAPATVVDGPALVHVYAESRGGTVYLVPGRPRPGRCDEGGDRVPPAVVAIPPERRLTVVVRDGEVACLRSDTRRPLEVTWHAHRASALAPEYRARAANLAKQP